MSDSLSVSLIQYNAEQGKLADLLLGVAGIGLSRVETSEATINLGRRVFEKSCSVCPGANAKEGRGQQTTPLVVDGLIFLTGALNDAVTLRPRPGKLYAPWPLPPNHT
ncbi:MAG: hypothetical protein DMG06_26360 [Acidobacteria bacterium]|nr:MAG: hypothetical protein DMG06_26360 [Acidobacteriota bacterium]